MLLDKGGFYCLASKKFANGVSSIATYQSVLSVRASKISRQLNIKRGYKKT